MSYNTLQQAGRLFFDLKVEKWVEEARVVSRVKGKPLMRCGDVIHLSDDYKLRITDPEGLVTIQSLRFHHDGTMSENYIELSQDRKDEFLAALEAAFESSRRG